MRIVVVGLGLIGGSLAGACRKKFPKARIIGVTRSRAALAMAKRKGWIQKGYPSIEVAFREIYDPSLRASRSEAKQSQAQGLLRPHLGSGLAMTEILVILCTPVDTLKGLLLRLDRAAPPGTVVTDAGSVKGFLVRWAEKRKWKRIHFVGAHPMAGSHERGIRNANPGLFKGSTTFVTPANTKRAKTKRGQSPKKGTVPFLFKGAGTEPLGTVLNFWKKISDRVVMIDAVRHDRITAEVSHLPHFLASVLVTSVSEKALPFASTGFLDTTRVAQGAGELWAPILLGNQREICRALAGFETRLAEFKKILARKDGRRLLQLLNRAGVRRKRIKLISRGLLL